MQFMYRGREMVLNDYIDLNDSFVTYGAGGSIYLRGSCKYVF